MMTTPKILTLVFPLDGGQVLLGLKKRGFGAGKWNGFGGKVEAGETIVEGAIRELQEEVGIRALTLQHQSLTEFTFEGEPVPLAVHIFSCQRFEGEPTESEEMRPRWYNFDEIPYDAMWVDDRYWMEKLLTGETWNARFHFTHDGATVLEHEFLAYTPLI